MKMIINQVHIIVHMEKGSQFQNVVFQNEYKCDKCKNKIGGIDHIPYDRQGHFRIFKDKIEEKFVMKQVNDSNQLKKNCNNGKERVF